MITNANRTYRWLLWTLALVGLAADQAGKYGVFRALHQEALADGSLRVQRTLVPGALELWVDFLPQRWPDDTSPLRSWSGAYEPQVNKGAFLGMGNGADGGQDWNVFFAVISVLAAGAIIVWSTRRSIARDRLLCVSLGLILAGTLGNLYDRVVFAGVRDFLYWHFIIRTAVFNLADFFLVCGALILLAQVFLGKPAQPEKATAEADATAATSV